MGLCNSAEIKFENGGKETISNKIISTSEEEGQILMSPNLKSFHFNELQKATRNFCQDSVLGEGGFGRVFKGFIDELSLKAAGPITGISIAVKMLDQKGCQGQQEWLAEIKYLGQLCHPNLVKLIGYCMKDNQRLLVYEFMQNGSLEKHLYGKVSHFQPLSWDLRMKVALGVAKGLAFIHNAAQVIFQDLKSSDILLDSDFNPKISDFGLARDWPNDDKSHVSSGYAALELEHNSTDHILTPKADVYNFGVILLELISGRPAISQQRPYDEPNLVEWATPFLSQKRTIFKVFDASLEGEYVLCRAQKAANLALHCLSKDPFNRPDMEEVVKTLEQITAPRC